MGAFKNQVLFLMFAQSIGESEQFCRTRAATTTTTSRRRKPNNHHPHKALPDATLQDPATPTDQAFAKWAKSQGIFAPDICCLTTRKSVGGRGLFATKPIAKGQVVASIPQQLILSSKRGPDRWAAEITKQVFELDDEDPRKAWVSSWSGGGCTNWEQAVEFAAGVDIDNKLKEAVQQRLQVRQQTWDAAAPEYQLDPNKDFSLYALVCSRACYLGPSWPSDTPGQTAAGIVPLFDMLNHMPSQTNVELISAGSTFAKMSPDSPKPKDLAEQDMLLVATNAIGMGKELFTEYIVEGNTDDEDTTVETKARKLVQWGFL